MTESRRRGILYVQ